MGLKKLTVRLCHLVAMEGKGTEFLKVKVWKGIGRRGQRQTGVIKWVAE